MCTLITAATAAMITMAVASTATSTAISLSQESSSRKLADYQIEQNKKEAQKAEMQAAYERQEGVEEARRQKINSILNLGNAKSKFAANNIALSSDLVLNLENDTKINSELDALTTQNQAERKAQNLLDRRSSLYRNSALISYKNKLNTATAYAQLGTNYLSKIV